MRGVRMSRTRWIGWLVPVGLAAGALGGCATFPGRELTDQECMTRVMYFESNRSSPDGMVAVGTTVMNRLATPGYPKTVCGVVGQPNQYARGVLTRSMNPREAARIATVADAVLNGERHPQVGGAMFFHTAGLSFPYTNMHYVAVAGGTAFYEKVAPGQGDLVAPGLEPPRIADPGSAPATIDDLLTSAPAGSFADTD